MNPKIINSLGNKIILGEGLDPSSHIAELGLGRRLFILSDENVFALHGEELLEKLAKPGMDLKTHIVPAGESSKSFDAFRRATEEALAWGMSRRDAVAAFGGGVVGDLGGFVASAILRGVGLIQIPTSLLAQVDSSIGGKTGINAKAGKNLVGSFHRPGLTITDIDYLRTLPAEEMLCGYAEVVKYALIGDASFFAELERADAPNYKNISGIIRRSIEFKVELVERDEKEKGDRALLNLGHTFAHALEAASDFRLPHGRAVAAGLAAAFKLSAKLGLCPPKEAERVDAYLRSIGFALDFGELVSAPPQKLLDFMAKDKKNQKSGGLTLILTKGVGKAFVADPMPGDKVAEFLNAV